MQKFLNGIIESIPLTIFLVYVQCVDMNLSRDWLAPYLLASVTGAISSVYLMRQGMILNRISMAINFYFLSGAFALIIEWSWLNQLYGQLRALGMLYWILLVGGITSVFSPFSFLGIRQPTNHSNGYWSIGLLLVCVLAIAVAIYFSNNKFWGEWFPFILLFSMRGVLQKLSSKTITSKET